MTPQDAERNLNIAIQNVNTAKELEEVYNRLGSILEDQNRTLSSYKNSQKEITRLKQQEGTLTNQIEQANEEIKKIQAVLKTQVGGITDKQKENLDLLREQVVSYQSSLTKIAQQREILEKNSSLLETIGNELKDSISSWADTEFSIRNIASYLMQVDKGIKSLQLNLGLSGNKADFLREQMYGAVNAAQRYGAGIQDVVELQSSVNDLTGRASVFGETQIANMVLIAKGTGLANQEAGQFVGNMLSLGSSVEDATKLIEGTVNETAKLGLNSSSVLKGISNNIGKLNSYRFQNGVEGLKKMVQASEKFKFSMDGAFAAAEKFRTLEGLLQAGAELRVLGGEFAKIDEFKFSFLARNKPEEFAIELTKLTKGMASFNKTTGEFDISDVDFDRLRSVAESTGRDINDLAKSTREFNKIDFAKKQIFVGTDEEKEMIAKLAEFSKGSTIGTIQIGDEKVKLNELTDKQLELYRQTQKTLKQRAEDSQTFNESFENTMMQFKSTLLPILDGINSILKTFNNFFDGFRDENGKMKKWAAIVPLTIIAASTGLFKLFGSLPSLLSKIPGIGKFFGSGATLASSGAGAASGGSMNAAQMLASGKGAMYKGFGSAAQLAAVGVAAVGIGYGFKMAAEGAASLSESISKLTGPQLTTLQNALTSIGSTMLMALAAGILAVGIAGQTGAIGLLAVGGAVALVGAGIGLAALGIGEMAKGFATIGNVDLTKIGSGMMSIAGASLLLANPMSMLGLSSLEESLDDIAGLNFSNVIPLQNLKFIDSDIKNMKMMVDLLNTISSIDTSKLDALGKLFSEGTMKVELVGTPTINNMITVDVDGEKFYKKVRQMIPIQSKKGVQPQGG
jgi:hypothetical protein